MQQFSHAKETLYQIHARVAPPAGTI